LLERVLFLHARDQVLSTMNKTSKCLPGEITNDSQLDKHGDVYHFMRTNVTIMASVLVKAG